MKVSVIFSTYNRASFLERSLYTYHMQSMPKTDFEIIVIDDQSTDLTQEISNKYSDKLNIVYIKISGNKNKFRAQSFGWNIGLSLAIGEVCLFTHPEIMMPAKTLEIMHDPHLKYKIPTFLTMKPYVLSNKCQAKIDSVNWMKNPDAIKEIPEFLDIWIDGNKRYSNELMEKLCFWESNTTFSMKRIDLLSIGGFDEFDCWGPDDPSFRDRRKLLKIPTVVAPILNYHQNHDGISAVERDHKYKCKKYFFPSSAKLRMKDHPGEYEIKSAYRVT